MSTRQTEALLRATCSALSEILLTRTALTAVHTYLSSSSSSSSTSAVLNSNAIAENEGVTIHDLMSITSSLPDDTSRNSSSESEVAVGQRTTVINPTVAALENQWFLVALELSRLQQHHTILPQGKVKAAINKCASLMQNASEGAGTKRKEGRTGPKQHPTPLMKDAKTALDANRLVYSPDAGQLERLLFAFTAIALCQPFLWESITSARVRTRLGNDGMEDDEGGMYGEVGSSLTNAKKGARGNGGGKATDAFNRHSSSRLRMLFGEFVAACIPEAVNLFATRLHELAITATQTQGAVRVAGTPTTSPPLSAASSTTFLAANSSSAAIDMVTQSIQKEALMKGFLAARRGDGRGGGKRGGTKNEKTENNVDISPAATAAASLLSTVKELSYLSVNCTTATEGEVGGLSPPDAPIGCEATMDSPNTDAASEGFGLSASQCGSSRRPESSGAGLSPTSQCLVLPLVIDSCGVTRGFVLPPPPQTALRRGSVDSVSPNVAVVAPATTTTEAVKADDPLVARSLFVSTTSLGKPTTRPDAPLLLPPPELPRPLLAKQCQSFKKHLVLSCVLAEMLIRSLCGEAFPKRDKHESDAEGDDTHTHGERKTRQNTAALFVAPTSSADLLLRGAKSASGDFNRADLFSAVTTNTGGKRSAADAHSYYHDLFAGFAKGDHSLAENSSSAGTGMQKRVREAHGSDEDADMALQTTDRSVGQQSLFVNPMLVPWGRILSAMSSSIREGRKRVTDEVETTLHVTHTNSTSTRMKKARAERVAEALSDATSWNPFLANYASDYASLHMQPVADFNPVEESHRLRRQEERMLRKQRRQNQKRTPTEQASFTPTEAFRAISRSLSSFCDGDIPVPPPLCRDEEAGSNSSANVVAFECLLCGEGVGKGIGAGDAESQSAKGVLVVDDETGPHEEEGTAKSQHPAPTVKQGKGMLHCRGCNRYIHLKCVYPTQRDLTTCHGDPYGFKCHGCRLRSNMTSNMPLFTVSGGPNSLLKDF